jgi:phosphomannomutase
MNEISIKSKILSAGDMLHDADNLEVLGRKDVFIFDIDGTLTESKSAMGDEMVQVLLELAQIKKVAIISGATLDQIKVQIVDKMVEKFRISGAGAYGANAGADKANFINNLYLLPTSGARLYKGGDMENAIYAEYFSVDEKKTILKSLDESLAFLSTQIDEEGNPLYSKPEKTYGEIVEDRGSQITFSGLGQSAPYEIKKDWDPDMKIRSRIIEELIKKIPQYEIKIGGSTSVDIVKAGINKAFGVEKLLEHLGLEADDAVFFGDAIFEGGNDYSVASTGVLCVPVVGPEETAEVLKKVV